MTRIIAYAHEADVHCPACAKNDALHHRVKVDDNHPHAVPAHIDVGWNHDEHGLRVNLVDREGNLIRPIFSTDEQLEPLFCGDCRAEI